MIWDISNGSIVAPMLSKIVGKPPHFVLWPTAISHPVVTTYPPSCLLTIMYQFLFYIGGWVVGPPLQKVPFICLHKILKAANNISPHNSLASVNYFIIILPRKNERCLLLTACCVSVSHERYWQALGGLRGLLNDGLPLTCAGVWGIALLTLSSLLEMIEIVWTRSIDKKAFFSDGLPSISTGGVLLLQHQRGWIERLFSMRDICCYVFGKSIDRKKCNQYHRFTYWPNIESRLWPQK